MEARGQGATERRAILYWRGIAVGLSIGEGTPKVQGYSDRAEVTGIGGAIHCKSSLVIFPSPSGMSITNSPWLGISNKNNGEGEFG